jgi:hypothetical protein
MAIDEQVKEKIVALCPEEGPNDETLDSIIRHTKGVFANGTLREKYTVDDIITLGMWAAYYHGMSVGKGKD